jgi:hypothetical protein
MSELRLTDWALGQLCDVLNISRENVEPLKKFCMTVYSEGYKAGCEDAAAVVRKRAAMMGIDLQG